MQEQAAQLAKMIGQSHRMVAFTGAGISTESGIPDFRSPGGIWSKYRPITIQEFLSSDSARVDYWRRYLEVFPTFIQVQPNAGHLVLTELARRGRLVAVITQNIDRLHQAAGMPEKKVIELHGRLDLTVCLKCDWTEATTAVIDRVKAGESVPTCPKCRNWIKPATISFGQELPQKALAEAIQLSTEADLFLAIGSSLTVYPAAGLPAVALEHGARLVIITASNTPYDQQAHLVINQSAGQVLSAVIECLDGTSRPA